MAQKDVELRIKARDDASRYVRKASDALKSLGSDLDKTTQGAGKAGSAMGGLAADVAKLQQQAASLKEFGRTVDQLDRVTTSVQRAEKAVESTTQDFVALREESARTATAINTLKTAQAGLTAQLDATRARQAAIKTQQDAYTESVRKAREERKRYNDEMAKIPAKQRTEVQVARGVSVRDAVKQAEAQSTSYRTSTNAEAKRLRDDAARLSAELTAQGRELRSVTTEAGRLETQLEATGNAMLGARADTHRAWQELERVDDAANKASTALGGLAINQNAVGAAAARLATQLAGSQRAMDAMNRYSTGNTTAASPQRAAVLQRQSAALDRAREDVAALRAEQGRLDAAMRSTSGNATQEVNAFNRLSAALRAAEIEVRRQALAMRQLEGTGKGFGAWARSYAPLQQVAAATKDVDTASRSTRQTQGQLAGAAQRTAGAMGNAAGQTNQLRGALLGMNGDARQSLGIFQRMRGEVLALTTSYIGFQAAVNNVGEGINAFRTVEGIESRLGAVFSQDTARVAQEMNFLRGQSDRLGITLGTLADTYSKFAVATSQANFTQQATRDIFLSVAEAGRVNKLSVDQMNGTFKALEQIVSKGKFSAEEVRGQLGDRLPGAFSILSNALGVTTAELDSMMKKGEVLATESNLLAFAEEMNRRFGPQLSASLDSVSTDIGRFENNVFKARLALAQGFIPELRNALQSFDAFANSTEGNELFMGVGTAVGKLVGVLGWLVENLDNVQLLFQTFVGMKIAGVFLNIAQGAMRARGAFVAMSGAVALIGPQTQSIARAQTVLGNGFVQTIGRVERLRSSLMASTSTTALARAGTIGFAASLTGLRTVMIATANVARTMWLAIGGLPGIIITGLVFAIAGWMGGVNEATGALSEHERQLDAVKQAYASAGDGVDNWAKAIRGVTLGEAEANLAALQTAFRKAVRSMNGSVDQILIAYESLNSPLLAQRMEETETPDYLAGIRQIGDWMKALEAGKIGIEDFRSNLDNLYQTTTDQGIKDAAQQLLTLTSTAEDGEPTMLSLSKAIEDQEKVIRAINGETEEFTETLIDNGVAVDENADRMAKLHTASEELRAAIPSLKEEFEKIKEIDALNTLLSDAIALTTNISEIIELTKLYGQALDEIKARELNATIDSYNGGSLDDTINRMIYIEGGQNGGGPSTSTARGIGQFTEPTWLGMFDRIFPEMKTLNATQKLALRTSEEHATKMLEALTRENQGALLNAGFSASPGNTYLAHFLGQGGAINALRADPNARAADVVDSKSVAANPSVFKPGMTVGDLIGWANGRMGDGSGITKTGQTETEKTTADQNESTQQTISDNEFAIRQQGLINAGKEREAEIQAAIRDARKENPNIGEAEINQITRQTGALFDQKEAEDALKAARATSDTISDGEFAIRQQGLINAGKKQQAAIEAALRDARKADPNITQAQLDQISQQAAALYTATNAREGLNAAEERANQLYELRQQLLEQQEIAKQNGDMSSVETLKTEIDGVNGQLTTAIATAIQMWQAVGGDEANAAIAKLKTMGMSLKTNNDRIIAFGLNGSQIGTLVSSGVDGIVGVFDQLAQSIANGENAFKALGGALVNFAATFLRQIAQMILQQMIFNALAGFNNPIGQAARGLGGIAGHTGGVVGDSAIGMGNSISGPSWASRAFTYHTGGIAGFAPDEIPAKLKVGEEILTEEDGRHRFNFGGEQDAAAAGMEGLTQVLALGDKQIEEMFARFGGKATMTWLQNNKPTVRQMLKGN